MIYEMTGLIRTIVFAMAFASAAQSGAAAQPFFDNDGPVLIWVTIKAYRGEGPWQACRRTIKAYRGEGPWQACRRVYQRDVFQVAAGPGSKVRCRIDHSRIYRPGEVRQNFNRN